MNGNVYITVQQKMKIYRFIRLKNVPLFFPKKKFPGGKLNRFSVLFGLVLSGNTKCFI